MQSTRVLVRRGRRETRRELRGHESEVDELEGDPEIPVGHHNLAPVLLQLGKHCRGPSLSSGQPASANASGANAAAQRSARSDAQRQNGGQEGRRKQELVDEQLLHSNSRARAPHQAPQSVVPAPRVSDAAAQRTKRGRGRAPDVQRRADEHAAQRGEDCGATCVERAVLEEELQAPRQRRFSAKTVGYCREQSLDTAPHLADDVAQQVEQARGCRLRGNRVAGGKASSTVSNTRWAGETTSCERARRDSPGQERHVRGEKASRGGAVAGGRTATAIATTSTARTRRGQARA